MSHLFMFRVKLWPLLSSMIIAGTKEEVSRKTKRLTFNLGTGEIYANFKVTFHPFLIPYFTYHTPIIVS